MCSGMVLLRSWSAMPGADVTGGARLHASREENKMILYAITGVAEEYPGQLLFLPTRASYHPRADVARGAIQISRRRSRSPYARLEWTPHRGRRALGAQCRRSQLGPRDERLCLLIGMGTKFMIIPRF